MIGDMTRTRWLELSSDETLNLLTEEFSARWHFCWEWDGLLVGPGMDEIWYCRCFQRQFMYDEAPYRRR